MVNSLVCVWRGRGGFCLDSMRALECSFQTKVGDRRSTAGSSFRCPLYICQESVKNQRQSHPRIRIFFLFLFFAADNKYLYSIEYTYVDMEVDENGLWAIYGGDQRENDLMVAKLNAESLQVREN